MLGVLLLVVAGVLVVLGGNDDDDGFDSLVEACTTFAGTVRDEYALSFPEGAPLTDAAGAEYLSHAFADTMDELVAELRALEPSSEVLGAIDALAVRIDEVRATPEDFVHANPLDAIAERFDEVDLAACGSEFFAAPE